jgi:hypothetical protein
VIIKENTINALNFFIVYFFALYIDGAGSKKFNVA